MQNKSIKYFFLSTKCKYQIRGIVPKKGFTLPAFLNNSLKLFPMTVNFQVDIEITSVYQTLRSVFQKKLKRTNHCFHRVTSSTV